jgi:L,D-peptidoglycan transpeptidase YkuD (ErfK/YbiS/YcfS/YnhG family)
LKQLSAITVRRKPGKSGSAGLLQAANRVYPCLLGKNGVTQVKREGDFATPSGVYSVIGGFFRADRLPRQPSRLHLTRLKNTDGWCDDPLHPMYNSHVSLPFFASHEAMFRTDGLYDVVVVLDWNMSARARFRGSAIFFHLTADKPYTAGCIAISKKDMLHLLPRLGPGTKIRVIP